MTTEKKILATKRKEKFDRICSGMLQKATHHANKESIKVSHAKIKKSFLLSINMESEEEDDKTQKESNKENIHPDLTPCLTGWKKELKDKLMREHRLEREEQMKKMVL